MQIKYQIIALAKFIIITIFISSCKNDDKANKFILNDTTQISKIAIYTLTDTSVFIKSENKWLVNNKFTPLPKALYYIFRIAQNVDIKVPVAKEKSDSIINSINKKNKNIVFYNENGEVIKSWQIGDFNEEQDATFAIANNTDKVYLVNVPGIINDLDKNIPAEEYYWISAYIFDYKPHEIAKIEVSYPLNISKSFVLEINKDGTNIVTSNNMKYMNEELESKAIGAYISYFSAVKFDSFLNNFTKAKKDSLLKQKAFCIINVTDINNKKQSLKGYFRQNPENTSKQDINTYNAVINNKEFVTVNYFDTDLLMKTAEYFKTK